mgnify:CR=1 FL=1
MSFLTSMFKTEKPVIGMLHLRPLPGDPLYYPGGSVSQVVEAAKRDLEALQQGGVDGILITNELSMPYEQHVSPSTLASMGYVIGTLSHDLSTPWGAEAIYDGDATIELCAAVDAQFTRCNFCGAWAGDLGLINRFRSHHASQGGAAPGRPQAFSLHHERGGGLSQRPHDCGHCRFTSL